MGFLDKIRGARKAAEEHQKKTVEQQQQTATPPPKQTYRHKPTHAAQDALTCMGGGVNDDLRDRIREQHKRRSKLTVSASHASLSSCSQLSGQRGYRKARESIAPNSPRDLSPGLGNDSVALRRGSIQPMSSSASGPVDQDDGNESLCGYFSSVQPNRQPSYTYTSATQQHRAYFSHPSSPGSLTRSRVPLAIAPTESMR